jgi:uncharacterized cupin superfamily protein
MPEPDITVTALDPETGERFQRLRRELRLEAFGLNLITLQPGQRGRIHAHERQQEVYLVLEGELTLVAEGEERVLRRWEIARVGPEVRRQLANAGRERLVLLALGGAGQHSLRDGHAWISWDDRGDGRPPTEVPLPEDLPVQG